MEERRRKEKHERDRMLENSSTHFGPEETDYIAEKLR